MFTTAKIDRSEQFYSEFSDSPCTVRIPTIDEYAVALAILADVDRIRAEKDRESAEKTRLDCASLETRRLAAEREAEGRKRDRAEQERRVQARAETERQARELAARARIDAERERQRANRSDREARRERFIAMEQMARDAAAEARTFTATEAATFDHLMDELEAIDARISSRRFRSI